LFTLHNCVNAQYKKHKICKFIINLRKDAVSSSGSVAANGQWN